MNKINFSKDFTNETISKKLLKLKCSEPNGLLLVIHHSSKKKDTRFVFCDFQNNGNLLAVANTNAQIYIIDFLIYKYWLLKKCDSCTCIKFSEQNESQILVGKSNGIVAIMNVDSGTVIAKLEGHLHPVHSISMQNNVCVTTSKYEALIWDISNYNKLQMLSLQKECTLKFVYLLPISKFILVCYQDDIIQIWNSFNFKSVKEFLPSNWKNYSVRSLAFSRNGNIMAVSGYLPVLAIFQIDTWKLLKIVNLPEYINTVRKIQFIPENFDAGYNYLLAILSGSGVIYFYNIKENILVSELKSKCEIYTFCAPLLNAKYITCLLCSGEVEIYDIHRYISKNEWTVIEKAQQPNLKVDLKLKNSFSQKDYLTMKNKYEDIFDCDKLKLIIKQYEEFPEAYRSIIWERLLKLPINTKQYNSIVNHVTTTAFNHLYKHFPLEDKVSVRCLKHLLNNIVTWCPFFANVDFLPCFLFPFMKVFHKKPIACFELCCTIIINWCQHWFEYHPLPPVNVLAIIDNILLEFDATLLQYFSACNIKPEVYSWFLLESAFSEVLTTSQWSTFWDHVFINEPAFLLCAVVAYILIQKKTLMLLKKEDEFDKFFHRQNPVDLKKFISKAYFVLEKTSEINHPRQYLNTFMCLTCGSYPVFDEYPKEVASFQKEQVDYLENQLTEILRLKENISKKMKMQSCIDFDIIIAEENKRMMEVEKACIQKIKTYQETLRSQQEQLKEMRKQLINQEKEIINSTQKKLAQHNLDIKANQMNMVMDGLNISKNLNQTELAKLYEYCQEEYSDLIKREQKVKELMKPELFSNEIKNDLCFVLEESKKLKSRIKKMNVDIKSPRKAHIALNVLRMNNLIKEIEQELTIQTNSRHIPRDPKHILKVHELEKETSTLNSEISKLLRSLTTDNQKDCSCELSATSNSTHSEFCKNKIVRFN